jgi:hypothetical protein
MKGGLLPALTFHSRLSDVRFVRAWYQLVLE